jgi:hypothetical protein
MDPDLSVWDYYPITGFAGDKRLCLVKTSIFSSVLSLKVQRKGIVEINVYIKTP